MSARRRVSTAVTMTVLVLILGVMAIWGLKEATRPIQAPDLTTTPTCTEAEKDVKKFLARKDVTVSVWNASKRKGLATSVLERLEEIGFRAGATGNAPEEVQVRRAQVLTTRADDPAAQLVALAFGKNTPVVQTSEAMGPGVDVVVGAKYRRLNGKAPRRIKLPVPVEDCVRVR